MCNMCKMCNVLNVNIKSFHSSKLNTIQPKKLMCQLTMSGTDRSESVYWPCPPRAAQWAGHPPKSAPAPSEYDEWCSAGNRHQQQYNQARRGRTNPVLSPESGGGQIHLNLVAINPLWSARHTPPTLTNISSSTYFFHVLIWSLSSFDHQPQSLMPFSRHDHPLSSTHDHTNEHCTR